MHQRGKIELAVFVVLGECRLDVRGFGLLLAVVGFDLRLGIPSSIYSVGYDTHTSRQAILAHTFPAELGEGKVSGEGVFISPRRGGWFGGGTTGIGLVKSGIKLCIRC
jgi:hypothetical protein